MASTYPGTLDAFTTIASDKKTSDSVGGRTHRDMHNDLGDAVEAVQAELGTDPAGTYSTVKARLDALVAYAAKTSAYTATVADHTLNVTSGTFTLDLPAASTCTGQSLKVKNSGTGVVTLDGNSSETVEGVATFPLGRGSFVEITSTGSAWILTAGVPSTGWRDMSADITAPVGTTIGNIWVRRDGAMVSWFIKIACSAGARTDTLTGSIPASLRPYSAFGARFVADDGASVPKGFGTLSGAVSIRHESSDASWGYLNPVYPTTTATWPTSLPGTAV